MNSMFIYVHILYYKRWHIPFVMPRLEGQKIIRQYFQGTCNTLAFILFTVEISSYRIHTSWPKPDFDWNMLSDYLNAIC